MVGKTPEKVSNGWKRVWKSFQWLENGFKKFPMIGKTPGKVSKWLETLKWECCKAQVVARGAAGLPILAYYGPRGRGAPDFGLVVKGGGEYFCKFFDADGFGQVVIHSGC